MKIFSFIKNGLELTPVEIEVNTMKGLPGFHFIGLPDALIKESQLRIKSALRQQGFEIPSTESIVVNLKPSYLKKSSRGLDLAVALAFLWHSNQLPVPSELENDIYIYGELSLDGTVSVPDDLEHLIDHPSRSPIVTGLTQQTYDVPLLMIKELKHVNSLILKEAQPWQRSWNRPSLSHYQISSELAELLSIIAVGEHPTLLAGPSGSGKTTAAEILYPLLRNPSPQRFRQVQQIARIMGRSVYWRPLVNPHHTIPTLSMVGGGVPAFPGEITRAHGGMLLLDEFLEFKSQVKEALREPIEKGEVTISRQGVTQKFPSDFLLIATTNLCPCGDFVPKKRMSCRYSLIKCRSYLEKLSGPILDRFQLVGFSHRWSQKKEDVSIQELFKKVKLAQEFMQKRQGDLPNAKLPIPEVEKQMDPFVLKELTPRTGGSRRRRNALLRVARTIADLELKPKIQPQHLEKAAFYTVKPYEEIRSCYN